MESQRVTLRAVISKSGDLWVGQCLEYDIAVQGKTPKELTYQLERAIVANLVIAGAEGMRPLENIAQAPQRYWKMFEEGLKVEPPEDHIFTVKGLREPPPIPELRLSEPITEPV